MTLGFYYHISVYTDNSGQFLLPSYLGLFVDELAKHSKQLYYFAYTSSDLTLDHNYELKQKNIQLVDLGKKKPYPVAVILGHHILRKFKKEASRCDAILVRAPSPLAPYFYTQFKGFTKIYYLMVGDYLEGIKHQNFNLIKQNLINFFTSINEHFQNKAIGGSGCIVNSLPLKIKYEKINMNIELVKTTTLTISDFYERTDTCTDLANIKLLFVGRIEKAKGMDELIAAFRHLLENKYAVTLHLAGWETEEAKKYFQLLNNNALTNKAWQYHGLLGSQDLFNLYRSSDIFVFPSHHEGFPRVIWEAMASSLPVIATNVGSIPYFLTDREHALLIAPKNYEDIYKCIIELIQDKKKRIQLISNAFSIVQENTNDVQIKRIFDILRN